MTSNNPNRLKYSLLWIFLGLIILLFINRFYLPKPPEFDLLNENNILIGYILIVYIVSALLVRQISFFTGKEIIGHIFILVSICFAVLLLLLLFSRGYYSRVPILFSYLFTLFWLTAGYYLFVNTRKLSYGVIPVGQAEQYPKITADLKNINIAELSSPRDITEYDGLIADFNSALPPQWIKFIADCHMKHIPVYDYENIYEVLTGKVNLSNKQSIHFETRYGSWEYLIFKRFADILFALLLLPVFTPVILLFAFIIRIESRGPVFYTQWRRGMARKRFVMYKLRSMYQNNDASLTGKEDKRITMTGKFIRKTRIDEMPQIFNVLKGDMSFIGPRPEYIKSDDKLRLTIPHYDFRYLARPGISGWSQVNIGHVTDEESTGEKLEMDIYYVKNISIWLDLHIVIKTVKVMFTGLGSK